MARGCLVCCGDAQPNGAGAFCESEYWSQELPSHLQNPAIPIHVKEFWTVIASVALWGSAWKGKLVYIFSDNKAVVDVLDKEKPRDPLMSSLLREFLYVVCTRGFSPVFRFIATERNHIADFLSRHHYQPTISSYLQKHAQRLMLRRTVPSSFFKPAGIW